ncbi:MAG: hypothetical protein OEY91_02630 [Nitrospirota bacterium]|nr:hypothetical protein [Nitrospirota bacterium]
MSKPTHMDQPTRTRLEQNIFPAAHQACEPWDAFLWHTGRGGAIDTHVAHSAQALAIDVFGTIKTSPDRDGILDALAGTIGLPIGGPWTITLEWLPRPTLLNEPHPTQVDVYVENSHSIILFQCKFTNQDEVACSQTEKQNGSIPCNGNYEPQINRREDMTNRCALSGQGIQYWDIIPKVFHLDAETDYQPCPFAGPAYQWMRNLVVAYKVARQKNKQPAVVIVYADHPGLPVAQKVRSDVWTAFTKTVRQDQVSLHVCSYQDILTLAQETIRHGGDEPTVWKQLGEWVNRKISAINAAQKKRKRKSPSRSNTRSAHR